MEIYVRYLHSKTKGPLKTWQLFDWAKSFIHALQKRGCWEAWKAKTSSEVAFLDPRLDNGVQIITHHAVTVAIIAHFNKQPNVDPEVVKACLLECLSLTAPSQSFDQV